MISWDKNDGIYESYPDFYTAVENGEVTQAVIEKDKVRYQKDAAVTSMRHGQDKINRNFIEEACQKMNLV